MSREEMFNKLCEVYFAEEIRLLNRVSELEVYCMHHIDDNAAMLQLIQARAKLEYFKNYILDVLNYLRHFDR